MKNLTINITNLNITTSGASTKKDGVVLLLLDMLDTAMTALNSKAGNTDAAPQADDDFPPDLGNAPDTCNTDAAPIHPDLLGLGDSVRYVRADGTGFTGKVLSTDGFYDDRTLCVRIRRDDTDKIVAIKKIGYDMTGKFFLLD